MSPFEQSTRRKAYFLARNTLSLAILWASVLAGVWGQAADQQAAHFHEEVQPLLSKYCFDCHGDGMDKVGVAFDAFKSDAELLAKPDLWWNVLKNLRAGFMPPPKKARPTAEEMHSIERWIKYDAFGLDPKHPDPGRVTIRRLNRVEYQNTIRDLMGYGFRADEEFPPDDTGYGFDNIGDVLAISPLLMEKYMQAAETIVSKAVPLVPKVVAETDFSGRRFRAKEGGGNGERMTFYKPASVASKFQAEMTGDYLLVVDLTVSGAFDFDPGRCRLVFKVDDQELLNREFNWEDNKKYHFEFPQKWQPGERQLSFELTPLTPEDKKKTSVDMRITSVKVQGPLDERHWAKTKNYDLFFTRETPPKSKAERRLYAREVLGRFAKKAFRRPTDAKYLDRLVALAEGVYQQPGKRFEEGIASAMVPMLASPRFLFRLEDTVDKNPAGPASPIDEYALASRLSYFLWCTMPDDELTRLADEGQLRSNLKAQVDRLLKDSRSHELVENFTGQWLQARDVEGISIDERLVLARDDGSEKELQRQMEEFRARLKAQTNQAGVTNKQQRPNRPRFRPPIADLDGPLRKAMRDETEMTFDYVVREDRNVLELLDSDYTFVNERLAKHYGIKDVSGSDMRRVTLPPDSPRGGILTQGTVLVVTSNPTRTSPVKRGLFLLDNILGSPPPPPPPDVPQLEESEKGFKDREPTLREVLEVHRSKPLCSSCHSRMDPLGLALENFNAMGMWREKERGQSIDTAGKLITGEEFHDIKELKRILVEKHAREFYRCLTEKLLTYALGRGLDYHDVETVDQIIDRLEREGGHFSALLMGIIESPAFQERRNNSGMSAEAAAPKAAELQANSKP